MDWNIRIGNIRECPIDLGEVLFCETFALVIDLYVYWTAMKKIYIYILYKYIFYYRFQEKKMFGNHTVTPQQKRDGQALFKA